MYAVGFHAFIFFSYLKVVNIIQKIQDLIMWQHVRQEKW